MLFSSSEFVVFLLVYYALHVATPARHRVYLIIAGSTVFYGWWKPSYVWLPYALVAIAYVGVGVIQGTASPRARKWRTAVVLTLLFAPLIVFKYANFVYQDVLGPVVGWEGRWLSLAMPLGLSFLTFTLTAFVVDSTTGVFTSAPRPASVLGYVLFFPHLIAGPILRPRDLIPQIDDGSSTPFERYAIPATIFTVGLIKKVVFADQIGAMVDTVYATPGLDAAAPAWLAVYGFAIQIYCDFSGYTDMAIGVAMLLGVRLPVNFVQPYTATSLVDFWRRWHVTLSFWLRDYLYVPLGGNRRGALRTAVNVVVTMTIGGLWHGANWTFVMWGLLHGCGVAVSQWWRRPGAMGSRVPNWLAIAATFHFVTLGWILFRAPSLDAAGSMIRALSGSWSGASAFFAGHLTPTLLIAVALLLHRYDDYRHMEHLARRVRGEILWPGLIFLWLLAVAVAQSSSSNFIYFDF